MSNGFKFKWTKSTNILASNDLRETIMSCQRMTCRSIYLLKVLCGVRWASALVPSVHYTGI